MPAQVTGVNASQGTLYGQTTLSWSSSARAASYDLYRSTTSGAKGSAIATGLTVTGYNDAAVFNGIHYFYTVVAKNGTGNGSDSAQAEGWGKVPNAVNTLAATQSTVINAVQLTWSTITDATGYKIYRSTSSEGILTLLGTSTATGYTDLTTGAGTAYYYKVSAVVGTIEGLVGNEAAGWGKQPLPVQVASVIASQGAYYEKVTLSWSTASGASSYDLYRSISSGSRGTIIASDQVGFSYDDTVASGGAHYFYTAVAKNATGSGPDSAQAEGWGNLPAPVNSLAATQGAIVNAVQLNWSAVTDATGYKIYRSSSSDGTLTLLGTVTATGYTDSTTEAGIDYYYKVSAVVGSVEGPAGNEAAGWGKQPAPVQALDVSASQGIYYEKITVAWSSSMGATGYDLYRSISSGTKGTFIASDLTGTTFDDAAASGGAHYFYTVVAKNGTGNAPDSAQAEGWGKLPSAVNTLAATQGTLTAKVSLSWVGITDATGYELYRTTTSGSAGTLLATLSSETLTFDDNTATPGSAFYYTIKTRVGALLSQSGNEATGWSKRPEKITSLTATQGTATGLVILNWNSDPEATGYEVWRSISSVGISELIGSTNAPSYFDPTVIGVVNYYYTVKTKVGSAIGPSGNEAKGFANVPPTSASVSISTAASSVSAETSPTIVDANLDAGQGESFAFAITEQPSTGLVSINNGKFVYTPPSDGAFAGTQSFKFSVTDRGGETLAEQGTVNVFCEAPSISSLSTISSVLIATEFSSTVTYSVPACSKSKQIDITILDGNNVSVSTSNLTNTDIGTNKALAFNTKGLSKSGAFTLKAHLATDIGDAYKTAQFTVKSVNLPVMSLSPSSSVIVGEDAVDVSLKNPAAINCQFTQDKNTALVDASKCLVEFSTPPAGLSVDNSGSFPALHGIIPQSGQYQIDANVSKYNGQELLAIGKVSKTLTATCPKPSITSLSTTSNLLPFIKPDYRFIYDALSCNGSLSGLLSITNNKDGGRIETRSLDISQYGGGIHFSQMSQGLPEGIYTASLSITGSEGTATKNILFSVKSTPLPTLSISPSVIDQGETKITVGITPALDESCPLTANQLDAENDPRRCFVSFNHAVEGLQTAVDKNGLPTLTGYTSTFGNFDIALNVSRWVDGQRYDSKPIIKTLVVRSYTLPVFELTGTTQMYAGVSKSDLILKQTDGTNCYLYLNYDEAMKNAINGKKACLASLTLPTDLSPVLNLNAIQLTGAFSAPGEKSISYVINRVFPDGVKLELASNTIALQVTEPPQPGLSFSGGSKIAEDTYFLVSGSALARLTVSSNPIPTAKLKITSDDGVQTIVRNNITHDSSFWITTENLPLLQERDVKVRVAWVDYPSVFSEKTLTVVGGPQITPKLLIESVQTTNSTDELLIKVKVGQYMTTGFSYDPASMGQWQTQLFVETNTSRKAPVSGVVDLINGEAEFRLNPANKLYMKISATADLVSSVAGLQFPIQSSTKFVSIVNTAPLIGTLVSKQLEAPAPKLFTLDLAMSVDNKIALKETHWEESIDKGASWQEFETLSPLRASVSLRTPSRKRIRVKMVSKSGIESYTEPVDVWAYSKLEADIIGPSHVAPGFPVTMGAELYRDGKKTEDAVYEWLVEYHDRTETSTGSTVTVSDNTENKVLIVLRARPYDTKADDKYAWTTTRHVILTKNPAYPSISAAGPRDIEIGKTYHYVGTTRPSWGNIPSVHTVKSEWQLPDGAVIANNEADWTPSEADLAEPKPLIFRAWVDSFKDTTTKETTVSTVPWEYVWPNFTVSMKQLTVQAPSDIILIASHDRTEMNRRFEGLAYEWSFPANVNGRQNSAFPNRAAAQVVFAGEYDITVTLRDARGHQTALSQHVTAEQAIPYSATIKVGKSNYYDRAPMTVTVRPTIYGGHPLDSVAGQLWKVDSIPVDEFANRSYMVKEILEPGNHVISYTLNSKMGETATVNSPLNLVANQPPVCELTTKPNVYVVYAEAKCADPDGKVIGYMWQVNGQPIGSTSYRISFSKTGKPQSAAVTFTATDDAKALSTPVSINVDY